MKTTRKINGAKVTREWPVTVVDETQKFTSKVLDKISKLIRGSVKEPGKHKTISVNDTHPGHGAVVSKTSIFSAYHGSLLPPEKQKPSALCAKLTSLRKKKVKVVDFWRDGAHWQIKVMA